MFRKILEILNYSNILISVAAGFLTYGLIFQIGGSAPCFYSVFVFFSTLATYNFQRVLRADELILYESDFLNWIRQNKQLIFAIILISTCFDGVIFLNYFKEFKPVLLVLSISLILSILYVVALKGHSLRSVTYVKMYVIAAVWTLVVGIVPLMIYNQFTIEKFLFVLAHFFLFLGLCIPFDVRDLVYDSSTLKTLPQLVGIQRSKVISVIFISIYYFLSLSLVDFSFIHLVALFLIIILLLKMSPHRSVNYYIIIDLSLGILGYLYVII